MYWYVTVKDKNNRIFFIKTDNLEYLVALTEESDCLEIHAQREQDVNVNIYTDLDKIPKPSHLMDIEK